MQNKRKKSKKTDNKKIKVLYQNLNGIWYAFTEHNQEVFYGKVPENEQMELADQLKKDKNENAA